MVRPRWTAHIRLVPGFSLVPNSDNGPAQASRATESTPFALARARRGPRGRVPGTPGTVSPDESGVAFLSRPGRWTFISIFRLPGNRVRHNPTSPLVRVP